MAAVAKLRSPIVLVHGLLGFDELRLYRWTLASYFAGIPGLLRSAGNRVFVARLSPTGGIARRAEELKAFLKRVADEEPVHLFAHSMGGLDARYMISRLTAAKRVLTLTTLGTPHRGSPFADWGVHRLAGIFRPALDWLSLPEQAFHDLTTERCREFNKEVPDAPGVRYFSVAGRHTNSWWAPEWRLPHRIVREAEGPNDGFVSVTSASYGESVSIWDGDHVSLVNSLSLLARMRGRHRDRSHQYAELIGRLADAGL